jgi:hypothetical protein
MFLDSSNDHPVVVSRLQGRFFLCDGASRISTAVIASVNSRHCERSVAIQCLDRHVASLLAMTVMLWRFEQGRPSCLGRQAITWP